MLRTSRVRLPIAAANIDDLIEKKDYIVFDNEIKKTDGQAGRSQISYESPNPMSQLRWPENNQCQGHNVFLGSKRQFTDWISYMIDKCKLIENVDFVTFNKKINRKEVVRGSSIKKEYGVTIDAAERIAIEENNEQIKYRLYASTGYGLGEL